MPARLVYQVYVGPSSKLYDFCIASVGDYCKAHGLAHIVQRWPLLEINPDPATSGRSDAASKLGYLPIFEKENAIRWLHAHPQVAVIDADVYIRKDAPNVFQHIHPGDDFAAAVERDMPLTPKYRDKIRSYSKAQYRRLKDVDWHWDDSGAEFYNMGVMVMNPSLLEHTRNETPAQFLARPEFKRFIDGVGAWKWSTDQTLLNWWLRSCGAGISKLSWKFNGLFDALHTDMISKAHFVHFFLRDLLPGKGEDVAELVK